MPVFRFKLHDTVTGERRLVSVAADSKEEAEATIMAQEAKKVSFTLDPGEFAELEAKMKAGTLAGAEKGKLFSHYQQKPYVIQKAKED